MKKIIIAALAATCLFATSCQDFLTKQNPNAIESEFFFSDETSLVLYTNGFIRSYMPTLIDFINGDRYSDAQSWDGKLLFYTDDFTQMDQTSWSWTFLRSINYFLENMRSEEVTANVDAAVINHYEGVGRFFRALFYFDKMKTYGAVPVYTSVIDSEDSDALYKGRDDRSVVAKQIYDDLKFACDNCLTDSKYCTKRTYINKYVALAEMARFCLYEGTYRKYHTNDPSKGTAWTSAEKGEATTYLNACIDACEKLMSCGQFKITDNASKRESQYRDMFICSDACSSYYNDIIWARDYDEGLQVNNTSYSVNDYMTNAQHAQYAFNRDFLFTYLMLDGTPFTSKYSGESYYNASFAEECEGRDYRLKQTIRTPGFTRAKGTQHFAPDFVFAKTGYQPVKYLTDEINDEISGATYSDAPVMRYAEVLLNYAEAKAELGACTQDVWNKTIKVLRERSGVKSIYPTSADPYMVKYFLGKVTDPLILEVRRERGVELCMESLRQEDCRRWHMGELLVRQKTGMYIPEIEKDLDIDGDGKVDNIVSAKLTEKNGMKVLTINLNGSKKSASGHILSEGDHGYIKCHTDYFKVYHWSEKKYLYPIPNVSVTMNENLGQNAGW